MEPGRYRLIEKTVGVTIAGERRLIDEFQSGEVIDVIHADDSGDGMTEVRCEGRTVFMFLNDLQNRAVRLEEDQVPG